MLSVLNSLANHMPQNKVNIQPSAHLSGVYAPTDEEYLFKVSEDAERVYKESVSQLQNPREGATLSLQIDAKALTESLKSIPESRLVSLETIKKTAEEKLNLARGLLSRIERIEENENIDPSKVAKHLKNTKKIKTSIKALRGNIQKDKVSVGEAFRKIEQIEYALNSLKASGHVSKSYESLKAELKELLSQSLQLKDSVSNVEVKASDSGIKNLTGYDCWVNSSLQLILQTDLRHEVVDHLPYDFPSIENAIGNNSTSVRTALYTRNPLLIGGQADAHEALTGILSEVDQQSRNIIYRWIGAVIDFIKAMIGINNEVLPSNIEHRFSMESNYDVSEMIENHPDKKEQIEQQFQKRSKSEPIHIHSVELANRGKEVPFQECLESYFHEEFGQDDDVYIKESFEGQEYKLPAISKSIKFETPPPHLLFQVKRFSFSPNGGPMKIETDLKNVPFEFELDAEKTLNNRSRTYELQGFVIHEGSANLGHYFTIAKAPDGSWYKYNDRIVTKIPLKDVKEYSKHLYLSYYKSR